VSQDQFPPQTPSYSALLGQHALHHPHAVAAQVDGGEKLTYCEWDRRATRAAHALVALGAGERPRIGLLFDNRDFVEYAVAYMGVLRANAVAAPLPSGLGHDELAAIGRRLGLAAIVRGTGADGPDVACDVISSSELLSAQPLHANLLLPEPGTEDLAEILHTSGSTGVPKAVAVTHANLVGELAIDHLTHPSPGSVLHAVPLGTNWAQAMLRSTLGSRMRAIVMPRFSAHRTLELIRHHRPTELALVPAAALLLVASEETTGGELASVKTLRLSAAPVMPRTLDQLLEMFPSATVRMAYSSTEAAPACTLLEYPPDPPSSVGRAPSGQAVEVVGQDGRSVAAGQVGEIRLRSLSVPPRTPLEPGEHDWLLAGGWVRTGDLGRLDEQGYLTVVGRKADVINVGGSKVFCPEVEAALLSHPDVIDAAAFGVADEVLGEQVAAAVVLSTPGAIASIRASVRRRLLEHKRPAIIVALPELPRTPAGKVARQELQRRLASERALAPSATALRLLETQLSELWCEALGLEDLGLDDDLAEIGAGSLMAFAVIARLRQRLEVTVPPSRFLALHTIREQARAVQAQQARDG
jgi:acyl-CoA synthetase (AMP-forming)/AMP-acid ligase II/acyl carrier protein